VSKEVPPAVVDYSKGEFICGFSGKVLRKSIYEQAKRIQQVITTLEDTLAAEITKHSEVKSVVGLLVALHAPDANSHTMWLKSMCERIVELQEEFNELTRLANGMYDGINYLLSPSEMKKFGL